MKVMKHRPRYGWIPDIPDKRDLLYKTIRPVMRLPEKTDLRAGCSVIEAQGSLSSCTAQALAGNLEYLDNVIDSKYTDVSRLFIYYNERVLLDSVEYDSGAYLRDGIKTLKNSGVCSEDVWPYIASHFDKKPSTACYADAKKHRIVSYHRIDTLSEMLTCLAEGYPFVFGFSVYESFESDTIKRTGIVKMPTKAESMIGGHAVMAVGYDRAKKRFIVRNSWGEDWGMGGYFTMPFEYLEELAADFWTIRK